MNATVGILTCLWAWNDFLLPLVILSDPGLGDPAAGAVRLPEPVPDQLPGGLRQLSDGDGPLLIVYVFSQRWVISGVTRGAVK